MVDHVEATTGPIKRDGTAARENLTSTGPDDRTVTGKLGLSKQTSGDVVGRWLTDRVLGR